MENPCISGLSQGRGVSKGTGGGIVREDREKVMLRKRHVGPVLKAELQGKPGRSHRSSAEQAVPSAPF